MNRKEFLDELNKRGGYFSFDSAKYEAIIDESFITDGKEKKLRIAQEECAELIQAISKYLREPDCTGNQLAVLEELADVMICLNYIAVAMHFSNDDVFNALDVKIERERKRLEEVKNVEEG